jgi:hypothetical protein
MLDAVASVARHFFADLTSLHLPLYHPLRRHSDPIFGDVVLGVLHTLARTAGCLALPTSGHPATASES